MRVVVGIEGLIYRKALSATAMIERKTAHRGTCNKCIWVLDTSVGNGWVEFRCVTMLRDIGLVMTLAIIISRILIGYRGPQLE